MKFTIGFLVVCGYIAIVVSTKCHHDDTTACIGHITCPADGEVIGCEHDQCTCVMAKPTDPPPMNCTEKADCISGGMTCTKDGHHPTMYDPSCLNNVCVCLEHPPK